MVTFSNAQCKTPMFSCVGKNFKGNQRFQEIFTWNLKNRFKIGGFCILNYVISWLVSAIGSKHRYIRCGFEFHMSHIFQHRLQHRFQLIFSSRLAYGLCYFPSSLQMLSDKYNIIYLLMYHWFNLLLAWTGLLKCFGNFTKTLHGILECYLFMFMSKFLMFVLSEIFMFFYWFEINGL